MWESVEVCREKLFVMVVELEGRREADVVWERRVRVLF